MKYRYALPDRFIDKVAAMEEFANGATQVTVIAGKDGKRYEGVLISGSRYIIAMRGFDDLPFSPSAIVDVIQTDDDRNPRQRGGWVYWDDWRNTGRDRTDDPKRSAQ